MMPALLSSLKAQIEEKEKSKREEEQEEKTFYCMQLEDQRQLLEENEREQQRQKERTKQFRSEIQKQLDVSQNFYILFTRKYAPALT